MHATVAALRTRSAVALVDADELQRTLDLAHAAIDGADGVNLRAHDADAERCVTAAGSGSLFSVQTNSLI